MKKTKLAQARGAYADRQADLEAKAQFDRDYYKGIAQENIQKLRTRQRKARMKKWKFLGEEQV